MNIAIAHIALIVRDPARTAGLFADVLGAQVIADCPDDLGHSQTFAKYGGVWFVLRQGDGPSCRNGDHIAFEVGRDELKTYAGKLATYDVEHFMAREDTALYFTDYDNHVFELDAGGSLDEVLAGTLQA
ncbi:VOC family protein [Dyella flagellata]|uniref:Fosfomycin resistance protein FosX n=1 Tax=Dyella flagellata TaxID=1867833 RepID=A0ABQ5X525_9GAMM|nr:VOC family protein [Dyella flagellata]GLQ86714.1 fosfomycin resistance protein FosX [Dyella flagellata]